MIHLRHDTKRGIFYFSPQPIRHWECIRHLTLVVQNLFHFELEGHGQQARAPGSGMPLSDLRKGEEKEGLCQPFPDYG
jgi:hypothetical protein